MTITVANHSITSETLVKRSFSRPEQLGNLLKPVKFNAKEMFNSDDRPDYRLSFLYQDFCSRGVLLY
jgi:hypothetical protein